jgi:hypothetical protein
VTVQRGAIPLARVLSICWSVGSGNDLTGVSPCQAVVGRNGERHGFVGLADLIATRRLVVDEAEDGVSGGFDMLQPLSAGVIGARLPGTENRSRAAAHIHWVASIDSTSFAVRIKASKATSRERDLGEPVIGDVGRGSTHDTRESYPDPKALNACGGIGR